MTPAGKPKVAFIGTGGNHSQSDLNLRLRFAPTFEVSEDLAIFVVADLLGNVLLTRTIDRVGAHRAVAFTMLLMTASLLLWPLAGSVVGIALIVLAKQGRGVPIPFGPYLALGGIAALFWGPQLAQFYLAG